MTKTNKRKYSIDLLIIALSSAAFYGIFGIFYRLLEIDLHKLPLLGQTLIGALLEYGLMGLGITIICARGRESFASFGLKRGKLLLTLLLSALVCLPDILYMILSRGAVTYSPFQGVNYTETVLESAFPGNVIGMLIIIITWGFFEGFSYVVLSDRINRLLPSGKMFLDFGAIICGVFCLAIHLLLGQTYGIGDALTTFVLIYGMLVVYRYTGNAWGCVFIYCFYWNAVA